MKNAGDPAELGFVERKGAGKSYALGMREKHCELEREKIRDII